MKGRIDGATTVTITKNEILTGLNERDSFRLALVVVGENESTKVGYVLQPFKGDEEALFGVTSVNFDLGTSLTS